jgi:hypothetical protein
LHKSLSQKNAKGSGIQEEIEVDVRLELNEYQRRGHEDVNCIHLPYIRNIALVGMALKRQDVLERGDILPRTVNIGNRWISVSIPALLSSVADIFLLLLYRRPSAMQGRLIYRMDQHVGLVLLKGPNRLNVPHSSTENGNRPTF